MPWHKPRFKLIQLILLVAIVAVELTALRAPISWIIAGLSLLAAMIASCLGPLTAIEWFGIVSVHILAWGLLAPIFQSMIRVR